MVRLRFSYSFAWLSLLALGSAISSGFRHDLASAADTPAEPLNAAAAGNPTADPAGDDFFEKRIRPILIESCQKCHGPENQKNALRLDSRAALLKGGETGPAVVPGKPEESLLVGAINHGELYQMPPKTKLPAQQIADLTAWVKMGAPWPETSSAANPSAPAEAESPDKTSLAEPRPLFTAEQKAFWAFQPPVVAAPPQVKRAQWPQSPLDRFILAGLEAQGLHPAPAADKRTLIRRATFDLIGLPPTPAEVEAFLADEAPEAFARVVDRLLASPHYGERWARHWLDVARYADSNGMDENVAYANAFRYRDYVVNAFNADKPYDQFVREQLAGDLLPASADPAVNLEHQTATGFLALGPKMLAEDDPRKMEMDIIDEEVDTVGRAFMGLTLGCARCHDHKFDPIPTADYYSLAGIFKSTKTMENFKVVAMWNERPVAMPEVVAAREAALAAVKVKRTALDERTKSVDEQLLATARGQADKYLAAAIEMQRQKMLFADLKPLLSDSAAPPAGAIVLEAEKFDRGNLNQDFSAYGEKIGVIHNKGELPNFAEYDISIPAAGSYQLDLRYAAAESRPIRILAAGRLVKDNAAAKVTGSWQPDTQTWSAECIVSLPAGKTTLRLERADSFPHIDKLSLAPCAAPDDANPSPAIKSLEQTFAEQGLVVAFLRQWVAYLAKADQPPSAETLAGVAADPKGPFALPDKHDAFYFADSLADFKRLREELAALEKQTPALPMAMGASEGKVENLRVHRRGNYLTLDREAPRQFLQIIAGEHQAPLDAQHSGRLQLADWIASPGHPLTARVMVNRVWRWRFGTGIVRSPDNFGRLGQTPDNQPLLDWLAIQFVSEGWSLKSLHRMLLLSSTYQMSTAYDSLAAAKDPENRLHWRANRSRLEAEALRDGILSVSGSLDMTMGGPAHTFGNHGYVRQAANKGGADLYASNRRSVYLPIIRSGLYDVFQAFDFADPSASNGERSTTTIAPQALALMNSRLIESQTKALAEQLLAQQSLDDAARVGIAYQRAYSRPPTESELARGLDFVRQIESAMTALNKPANECRTQAWQSLCRVILASSEFIYVE